MASSCCAWIVVPIVARSGRQAGQRRQTVSASTVAATSCTRTMRAPRCDRRQRRRDAGGQPLAGRAGRSSAPSVDLRDQPTSSGTPEREQLVAGARSSSRLCAGVLPKPMPGSSDDALAADAGRLRRADPLARGTRATSRDDVVVARLRPASIAASPRMCIRQTPQRRVRGDARRARPARAARAMSLTMSTPRSSAARITSGLLVSTETGHAERRPPPRAPAARARAPRRRRPARAPGPARLAADVEDVGAFARAAARSARCAAAGVGDAGRRRRTNRA